LRELYSHSELISRPDGYLDKLVEVIPAGPVTKLRYPSETFRPQICHDTNLIHQILPDGRVVYAQACQDAPGGPVTREWIFSVPAAEAEGLNPGDEVEVVRNVARTSGHVGRVYQGADHKTITRIRGIVLGPHEPLRER
jgi:hypothetical protein